MEEINLEVVEQVFAGGKIAVTTHIAHPMLVVEHLFQDLMKLLEVLVL